ncbi:MAG: UDP-N-acetylglucosamine 1-carboxyvinyltransferase [Clostridiales bacterium]|nr:UDP-N-acetylglucosamine 1-carboxyvinyltransferase [Clostridiales bacterium]
MSSVIIQGKVPLSGEVHIHGSKNAALPIIAATVLNHGTTALKNCPKILDVLNMIQVLEEMGCRVNWDNTTLVIDARDVTKHEVLEEAAKKTRGSFLFLGAMLGRHQIAKIAYPGGCSIGARKVDIHLRSMEEMGVVFFEDTSLLYADGTGIHGTILNLVFPSVGATENILLAACLAPGRTEIINAALEPEVIALCEFLNQAGAKIQGIRTSHLIIDGVSELHDCEFTIPPDRIVAGTYLAAVAACGGDAVIDGVVKEDLTEVIRILRFMGCDIDINGQRARIQRRGNLIAPKQIVTKPFPGFPTDMQSQFMVVLSQAFGDSVLVEEIFEERFLISEELIRLGAKISVEGKSARIQGKRRFLGNTVRAKDLRGGAALIIAGLVAEGSTIVEDLDYVKRGYVDIVNDLRQLNADIRWLQ